MEVSGKVKRLKELKVFTAFITEVIAVVPIFCHQSGDYVLALQSMCFNSICPTKSK